MSTLVESIGSCPAMIDSVCAASRTSPVIGPAWSSDDAKAIIPYRDTLPYAGFTPMILQNDAGSRIDPPVSVPNPIGTVLAPTVLALPPDDPPGTPSRCHGLRVGPNAEFSHDDPIANSSMLVLPMMTAPAFSSLSTTVAEYGARKFSRIFDPAVVISPATQKRSFTATGTPARGPSVSPDFTRASIARAFAKARSGSRRMYACSCGSSA